VRPAAYVLAVLLVLMVPVLGFLGLTFVVGAQGQALRIVVGVILLVAAGGLLAVGVALIWITVHQPPPSTTTIVQKIELPGNVTLENLQCRSCGATLTEKSITVQAGAVFVRCEYCGAAYQLEEEPKW
jgi:hypothetical protein